MVCAAPLANRAPAIAAALRGAGYEVTVVSTPQARHWIDESAVADVTGRPLLVEYREPQQAKRGGRPDVVVVCPATFNTLNKWAVGVSDDYALGVLNEALASRTPLLAVPFVSDRLWPHPAFAAHLDFLAHAGVVFVDPQTGQASARPVRSGTGSEVAAHFDPAWLVAILRSTRRP